ncbi:MAG TPA: PxKF domain-containing protein [Miltoncostaeaceae bacterium]|nr:PxKF domain-containing protein [Miltoncostaeaceae bacterium]
MLTTVASSAPSPGQNELVSVRADGTQGNLNSGGGLVSADGRYVAFSSSASNLVPGDSGRDDAFLKDLATGALELVSVNGQGAQSDGNSYAVDISGDGRYVAFVSTAMNLVPGYTPTGPGLDLYVKDRATGGVERISVLPAGTTRGFVGAVSLSADARYVAWVLNGTLYRRDRLTGTTIVVAQNVGGVATHISDDGRFIAFVTQSTGIAGIPQFAYVLADAQSESLEVLSVLPGGAAVQGEIGGLSGNARFAVFSSAGRVYLRDRQMGTTERVDLDITPGGSAVDGGMNLSNDGRFISFKHFTNSGAPGAELTGIHVELRDRRLGLTRRVTTMPPGTEANGSQGQISSDGSTVVWLSAVNDVVEGDTNTYVFSECPPGGCAVEDVFAYGIPDGGAPVDNTPPTVTLTSPVEGASAPRGSAVVADYSCLDEADGSGIASCDGTVADGAQIDTSTIGSHSFTVTATDNAGNTATVTHTYVVTAQTEAVATAPPGGTVGTNTTVSPEDPIGTAVTTPAGGTVTINEAPTTTTPPTGYALLGQQVQITAPTASVAAPLSINFYLDASLLPSAGADTVTVFRDGVGAGDCTGATGTASPDPCVSQRSLQADGSLKLSVLTSHASTWNLGVHKPYAFTGFYAPVDNAPTLNTVKAGSAIPVKFALGGDQGLDVFVGGYPRVQQISCSTSAPLDAIEETATANASGLTFDRASLRYSYVWKTNSAWKGSCRRLQLKLKDGTLRTADFKLT